MEPQGIEPWSAELPLGVFLDVETIPAPSLFYQGNHLATFHAPQMIRTQSARFTSRAKTIGQFMTDPPGFRGGPGWSGLRTPG